MEFQTSESGDILVVSLPGNVLDANNTNEFKESIAPILESGKNLVFDMNALQFIDSSGCGAILSCLRKVHEVGFDIKLASVTGPVKSLFQLIRMDKIFEIYDSVDAAVAAY